MSVNQRRRLVYNQPVTVEIMLHRLIDINDKPIACMTFEDCKTVP